ANRVFCSIAGKDEQRLSHTNAPPAFTPRVVQIDAPSPEGSDDAAFRGGRRRAATGPLDCS
ncbi:MAG TPA: hypothetical protein VFD36_07085, partial [Kofleriaceae bacterium]|nr:hypothetical protein [Kofleriaceae bacterium]